MLRFVYKRCTIPDASHDLELATYVALYVTPTISIPFAGVADRFFINGHVNRLMKLTNCLTSSQDKDHPRHPGQAPKKVEIV